MFRFLITVIPELLHIKMLELRGAYDERTMPLAARETAANGATKVDKPAPTV
jgi:hypothetical protein